MIKGLGYEDDGRICLQYWVFEQILVSDSYVMYEGYMEIEGFGYEVYNFGVVFIECLEGLECREEKVDSRVLLLV